MTFIAEEAREYMAELGFRTFDDMVGHVERLEVSDAIEHFKAKGLDFTNILMTPEREEGEPLRCVDKQDHDLSLSLDQGLIEKAKDALEKKKTCSYRTAY